MSSGQPVVVGAETLLGGVEMCVHELQNDPKSQIRWLAKVALSASTYRTLEVKFERQVHNTKAVHCTNVPNPA